jgi:RNA polymerase sigma-70 factor, ECF subfamily
MGMIEDEGDIRDACCRGHFDRALEHLVERYGAQLLGYLCAICRDDHHGREVYSILVEDLWRGLPAFEWRCTARAWAFKLARNARARFVAGEVRRARREELIDQPAWLVELVDRTRSPTPFHARTEIRDRVRELRARLDEQEQTLLMLRVDRQLPWQELAVVLDEVREGERIASAAARLRQRFQVLKTKLRGLAEAEGLLTNHDS